MRTAPAPPARPMPPQTGQSQVKPIGIIPCSEHMVTGSEHTSAQSMDGLGGIDLGRGRESTGSVIDAYKVVNESDSSLTRPSTASSSAQSYDESGHNVLSSHTSHTVARSAHLTNSSVLAQAFKVLAEVKQLPHAQQGGTYQKISQALEIIRVPSEDVTVALPNHQQIVPAADHWEVAPGHLARQDLSHAIGTLPPVAFSTFLLRREVVNFDQAQHISSGQKVLNKHVPPSACVRMCESKADWTCVLSVLQGVINVKTPGLNANIGQGGVVLVTLGLESLFTNTTDQEAKIQFWWTKAD
ncbi:hypothetical protein M406DRAFT_354709 [Cryphonectria parasitica EP155]|uniref:Uncharacterized protein n=1 Tax=Cryphonectria parasitica (strain ATCC 38755 / EP155) TaxID=660469 RepID=A0A9P4YE91_CRYP1|nr:uncharacterized protein M406DRAFT_354709 [Cryphonectria parasitica EP155]KAF3771147.1 hypothetical protein M406DRAFT_354709 [Cryphonectria parasitica EP155]